MERAMGIEPTSGAWRALILPLNYARKWCRVRESNPQSTDYKSVAIPVSLTRQ